MAKTPISGKFFFIFLSLIAPFIQLAYGLKCYTCDGFNFHKNKTIEQAFYNSQPGTTDKSCYGEGTPLEKFVRDCEQAADGFIPVCVKTHLKATLVNIGETMEDTGRLCDYIPKKNKWRAPQGCRDITVGQYAEIAETPNAAATVRNRYAPLGMNDKSPIQLCTCYDDLCNKKIESGAAPRAKMLKWVKEDLTVVAVGAMKWVIWGVLILTVSM